MIETKKEARELSIWDTFHRKSIPEIISILNELETKYPNAVFDLRTKWEEVDFYIEYERPLTDHELKIRDRRREAAKKAAKKRAETKKAKDLAKLARLKAIYEDNNE